MLSAQHTLAAQALIHWGPSAQETRGLDGDGDGDGDGDAWVEEKRVKFVENDHILEAYCIGQNRILLSLS